VRDGNSSTETNGSPEGQLVGGIAGFGNDIATLAELQTKLFMIDLRTCLSQVLLPLALIGAGLVFLLGAIPVALMGVATLLAAALNIGTGAAMLLTGAVVLVLSIVVIVLAGLRIGPSLSSFRQSNEELARNVAWVRTVLLYSGRNVPRRRI